jgi:hypothetical protein
LPEANADAGLWKKAGEGRGREEVGGHVEEVSLADLPLGLGLRQKFAAIAARR